jgi:regulator of cell morphogenesis and NO signaling
MNLLDQTIGDIACELPGATAVFHAHRLDFCCGGGKPLRDAIAKRGADQDAVLEGLAALAPRGAGDRDWRAVNNPELIEHILARFHERHREQLPELIRLARRVEHVHGERPECPRGLTDHLETMASELESHMEKEEQILFPMLRASNPMAAAPISVMRFEHDQHGEALAALEALTNNITPPPGACNTWRALYAGMAQLRSDLMEHIHLENNVLFQRV